MAKKPFYFFISVCLFISLHSNAQEKKTKKTYIGFIYGFGTQQSFPFKSKDYDYKPQSFKAEINIKIAERRKWDFEVLIEPGLYVSKHQLLNKWYVKPSDADNYLELRDIYTQEKTINEYSIGVGFIARYKLFKSFSAFALGSVGPTLLDTSSERLDKGFAFSDVFALGFSYETKSIIFDARCGIRHVSNADLREKNNGYNNSFIEFGFRIPLKKRVSLQDNVQK